MKDYRTESPAAPATPQSDADKVVEQLRKNRRTMWIIGGLILAMPLFLWLGWQALIIYITAP